MTMTRLWENEIVAVTWAAVVAVAIGAAGYPPHLQVAGTLGAYAAGWAVGVAGAGAVRFVREYRRTPNGGAGR